VRNPQESSYRRHIEGVMVSAVSDSVGLFWVPASVVKLRTRAIATATQQVAQIVAVEVRGTDDLALCVDAPQ